MGNKYLVSNPASAGQVFATYDATSQNDTDWHSLSSDDFYDTTTGTQLDAGLKFAFVGVASDNTTAKTFIKLRAASGAGDSTANSGGVIPVLSTFNVDSQALANSNVTSIAYKKAAGSDIVVLYCGFNR
jgi:hypothetical protein